MKKKVKEWVSENVSEYATQDDTFSVGDLKNLISGIYQKAKNKGLKKIRLGLISNLDEDNCELFATGYRDETDLEYECRVIAEDRSHRRRYKNFVKEQEFFKTEEGQRLAAEALAEEL